MACQKSTAGDNGIESPQSKSGSDRFEDRLALLAGLSGRIISNLDPDRVYQDIVAAACELTLAHYGALAIFDDFGVIDNFTTHGIGKEEKERIGGPPTGRGLLGVLPTAEKPLRLADLRAHAGFTGFPPGHPEMKTFLGAPIYHGDERLGNLYLAEKAGGREFTSEDENLVIMFAAQAAMAIRHSQLYARESTLREQAEMEHARLTAIIDSSAAGIVVVEAPDGRVVLANQEAKRILGFGLSSGDDRETYEYAAVYRRPDGSPYGVDELPLQRALRHGETSQGVEVIFDFADGRRIPTVVNASPVYDESGYVTAAIAVIGDISALQEVERLKAEFLSMVTHDLRGPLSTIKGLSSSMLMDSGPVDDETTLEYVRTIDEEADRMSELVGNLLDMSRIEADAMSMDPELCHLADITAEAVRRIERSREGGNHKIVTDVPLTLPEIFADYDQIGRVLSNLLSNAIKYSPQGSEVRITSYQSPDNSGEIVTKVADDGVGIPSEEMDKIFDKFYRVTSQRGRGRPGSGLGLAICKAIIESHDGKIWVESEPGKGSTFYFSQTGAVASVGYD
jgi:PAS domain S-box-containing protein